MATVSVMGRLVRIRGVSRRRYRHIVSAPARPASGWVPLDRSHHAYIVPPDVYLSSSERAGMRRASAMHAAYRRRRNRRRNR